MQRTYQIDIGLSGRPPALAWRWHVRLVTPTGANGEPEHIASGLADATEHAVQHAGDALTAFERAHDDAEDAR